MEVLLFILLEIVLQIVFEIVFGMLWELAVVVYKAVFDRSNWGTLAAVGGYLLLGVAVGGVSIRLWPTRVFHSAFAPGLSLVLSPLCVGWVLAKWGDWRRARGRPTSSLATFAGGAALAFGTALVRFLWVK